MPNWKNQLILAIALFGLGSGAYWLEYTHRPKVEEREEQAKKIFDLKEKQIASIRVQNGAKAFVLGCADLAKKQCRPGDNSKWSLTAPAATAGDDSNANALVSSLNNLTPTDTIALQDETPEKRAALLKEYGLDAASRAAGRRITVELEGGASQAVSLGGPHPIGEGIFALREESGKPDETRVYVIPGYFKTNFERDLTFWRNKKLFEFAAADVESFWFKGAKGKVNAEKKDGNWSLESAGERNVPGDSESIDALLSAAAYLVAKDFVTDPKAAAGAQPSYELSLALKAAAGAPAPKVIQLHLSQKAAESKTAKPRLFARASTLSDLVELDPTSQDRLDKGLKDLRQAKLLTSLERYSIKRLEVSGPALGATPLVLVTQGGGWAYEPKGAEVNPDKVQALLEKLSGNRIKEFLKQPAVEAGATHVILGDEKTPAKRHLIFWKKGNDLFAKDLTAGRAEIFKVDAAVGDELPRSRTQFDKTQPEKKTP
jgi:hypothetical protein